MSLIIRDMEERDIEDIIELGVEHADESPIKSLNFHAATTRANFRKVVLDKLNFFCKIAVDDESGEYIALLLAQRIRPFFSDNYMAQDVMFRVREQFRTKYPFVAIKLIKEYHQWAADLRLSVVVLSTMSGIGIDGVARMYERLGFKQIGSIHALGA